MKQITNKGKKSIQPLQVSNLNISGNIMPNPDHDVIKNCEPLQKVIADEKENIPVLRRSKRKNIVSDILSTTKSVDKSEPKSSKKESKTASESKKSRKSANKKNDKKKTLKQESNLPVINETEIVESDKNEKADKPAEKKLPISVITEDSGYDPSLGSSAQNNKPAEKNLPISDSTGDSGYDPGLGSSAQNTPCQSIGSTPHPIMLSPDWSYILTSSSPEQPLIYWKELAEQRRCALEKALHENELLHDQLVVLETENSQLKQLMKEAQEVIKVLQGIIE